MKLELNLRRFASNCGKLYLQRKVLFELFLQYAGRQVRLRLRVISFGWLVCLGGSVKYD